MPDGYKITGTDERERLGPTGEPTQVKVVYITTARGVRGSVEVQSADWTAEKLREILSAKADELDLAFTL